MTYTAQGFILNDVCNSGVQLPITAVRSYNKSSGLDKHIYCFLTFLEVRSLKWISLGLLKWGQIKGLAGLRSIWWLQERIHVLTCSSFQGHLHLWLRAPFPLQSQPWSVFRFLSASDPDFPVSLVHCDYITQDDL